MNPGVLTSDTVPVNWTIEGTTDNALRKSMYVLMQAAYDVTDELGYHQAASLLTAQLTDEVNALSKRFAGGTWIAESDQDAVEVARSLLISGVPASEMSSNTVAFFATSVPGGVLDETVRVYDLPHAIGFAVGSLSAWQAAVSGNEVPPDRLITVTLVNTGAELGTFLTGPAGSGIYYTLSMPFSTTTTLDVAADNSITVPDSALPGDILKANTDPPTYYIVDVSRSANKIGNNPYLPIPKSADATKIDIWDQKLSQAINELTRNGQIEAARLQQLVNLLQNLLAAVSNTEAKETRVKESILSKF